MARGPVPFAARWPLRLAVLLAMNASFGAAAESRVPDFRLLDQNGVSRELYRYADRKAVVLIVQGNGCPILRKSAPEILALRNSFSAKGVAFLLINANPQDSRESVAREAADYGLDLPVLIDEAQSVAKSLAITRTAEALVIDPKRWRVVYRGALDDRLQYGVEKPAATKRYVANALEALLAGRAPTVETTEAFGCLIRIEEKAASYTKDAAPILKAKCLACHLSSDGPAPMTSYEKVRGWAPMIRETILTRRMPPWSADPQYIPLANDMSLSRDETRALISWIDAGAPRDGGPDPLEASRPERLDAWPLGQPDRILSMPKPVVVPAKGVLSYQYFTLAGPLEKDLWIGSMDIRPSNPKVVHHAILFDFAKPFENYAKNVKSGEMSAVRGPDAGRYTWNWNPGRVAAPLPKGAAIHIPKGHYLVLEIHYNPSGREETDRTQVGLYDYRGEGPPKELKILNLSRQDFSIPPGEADYRYARTGPPRFERDAYIVSLRPHMHFRGHSMKGVAHFPDGTSRTLLSVTDFDSNWQHLYTFAAPQRVPAGTMISMEGSYDNSPMNPANPDPTKTVTFGLSSSDEMFVLALYYFYADDKP